MCDKYVLRAFGYDWMRPEFDTSCKHVTETPDKMVCSEALRRQQRDV